MTTYIHRCLIITASQQSLAQSLCEQLAGPAGANMFTTPLSSTGTAPATHYISAGMIEDSFAGTLANAETLHAVCQMKGVVITLAECRALLSGADVSEDEPFDAMARRELKLIQETL